MATATGGRGGHETRTVARQSGAAGLAAAVAVASGLVLDVTTAALFGAGPDTDAFVAAARLTFALTAVLMVLSTQVLVPSFASWSALPESGRGNRRGTTVLLAALLGGLVVAAGLFASADPLLRLMAPGFSPGQHELAVQLSRMMVFIVPLTAGSEVLRAWLNASRSYLIPAGMTLVLNVAAIAVLLIGADDSVVWIPIAYLAGAGVQFGFMLSAAAILGFRPGRPDFADPRVTALGRLLLRPTVGAGLNPLARTAETFAASFLPAGSMTILHYGNRIVSAAGGTVAFRSVMVVILPRLTSALAQGQRAVASAVASNGIRLIAAIAMPLTTIGAVLAVPSAVAVFSRGEFAGHDARLLGYTLAVYALSFLGSGLQRALLAPCYAVRDTRTPLANTAWGVAANVLLLALLIPLFEGRDAGLIAVAAAYSMAQYVNVAHAGWHLRRSRTVDVTGLRRPLRRTAVAAALGGLAAAAVAGANAALIPGWLMSPVPTLIGTAVAALAGTAVVVLVEMTGRQRRAGGEAATD